MMKQPLTAEQWLAARALVEGEAPTHARVASCLGVNATTVSHTAAQEEWQGLDFRSPRVRAAHKHFVELAARNRKGELLDPVERGIAAADEDSVEDAGKTLAVIGAEALAPLEPLPDETPEERMTRIGEMLVRQADTMLRRAELGRPLETRQVAALSAMTQLAERIAVIAREHTFVREQEDEEKQREFLRRMDDRVRELGLWTARQILVERCGMSPARVEALVVAWAVSYAEQRQADLIVSDEEATRLMEAAKDWEDRT